LNEAGITHREVTQCCVRLQPYVSVKIVKKIGKQLLDVTAIPRKVANRALQDERDELPSGREATPNQGWRDLMPVQSGVTSEEPRGELTVRTLAMPADTNANGDIFGGWVLSQMDQAGGIAGVERARGRVVTIAVDAMTFIRPVKVGDVLCVYTAVEHVGRTSMKIHIEAWSRRFLTGVREKVTVATFTFVAIDDEGRPRPIPATGV
jgi:acyl-CoA thioesterase YciA